VIPQGQNPQAEQEQERASEQSTNTTVIGTAFTNESKAAIHKSKGEIGRALVEIANTNVTPLELNDPRADMIEEAVSLATLLSDDGKTLLRKILTLGVGAIYKPGEPLSATDIATHARCVMRANQSLSETADQ